MQVQLLLEDNLMELDSTVSFPMNKVFSNLSKPTDIFVDYTKNIAVPATAHNNKILGNAYRLDKQFGTTDSALGLSMNPLKRIPAKLLYNNELIFDGYAKYTSSTQKDGNIYYNLNLYGAIGDVFQSLVDVVLDYNKLSDEQKAEEDGGAKYILDDLMYETPVIDMSTVNTCWEYDGEPLVDSNYYSVIGFAPAYRGLYDNFESNSIVGLETVSVSDGTPKSVEDVLKEEWKVNIKQRNPNMTDEQVQARVDAIDFKSVIGNGINEHSIRQFRSYTPPMVFLLPQYILTIILIGLVGIIADYNDSENTKITVVGVGRGTSRVVGNSSVEVKIRACPKSYCNLKRAVAEECNQYCLCALE